MSYQKITFEIKDKVAFLGFGASEGKSMTTLSKQTLSELETCLGSIQKDLEGLIFFSHKKDVFLAGVDIELINGLDSEQEAAKGAEAGQKIYNLIEDLPYPTIACIDGVCLGGGLELSLSCDKILVSKNKKTKLGLPEVQLGLLPGFGGTLRLPKRVGLPFALEMILSGKQIDSRKALKSELAEASYPAELLVEQAILGLKRKVIKKKRSFLEEMEKVASNTFFTRKIIFQKARENVLKKTKGFYHAPLKILEMMEGAMGKSREAYLALEAEAFGELCMSSQSRNLQHIFFMQDKAKKKKNVAGTELRKIKQGAVLGAGTMGGGIAWLFAQNKQAPLMKDLNTKALDLGLKQSSKIFGQALKRKKISEDDFQRFQRSILPTLKFDGFGKVDLVIEAVIEDMKIKKSVFQELETHVSENCLITSNTSSLSVQEMATSLSKSDRFAGLHFFNPVNKMPLVEIITHDNVSQECVAQLYNWVLQSKKVPVVVKDGPGFLVNRILMPFLNEAAYLLDEGVSPKSLDQACLNFGMPMGPCRLMDEIGIDVLVKVGKIMHQGLGERAKASTLSERMVEQGLLGKKSKKGFYLYQESEELNPEVKKLLPSDSKKMDEVNLQMRVFLPMINEAARILDEKIVEKVADVDLGLIFGIGFPPFRGGLLRYADSEGLDRIASAMKRFASEVSADRYEPYKLINQMASEGKSFYELDG